MDEDKDKLIQEASRLRGQEAVVEVMFRLKKAITDLNEVSTKQQNEIIKLTRSIKWLTFAILLLTLIMVLNSLFPNYLKSIDAIIIKIKSIIP